jgi:hypothetical protein
MKTALFTLILLITTCNCCLQAQVPSYVPQGGLVGWWALDGNTNDASGKGNHGSSNGAVSTTDRNGKVNGAYYFDGIDDNITIPNSASLNPEYITICGWFKTSTIATDYLAGAKSLVSKWYWNIQCDSNSATYAVQLSNIKGQTQLIGATIRNYMPETAIIAGDEQSLIGGWNHFAFVHGESGQKLYINGRLAAVNTTTGKLCATLNPLLIGADNYLGQPWRHFMGKIDDVGIWDRALTDQEVTRLFEKPSEPECSEFRRVSSIQYDTRNEVTWTSPALQKGVRYRITGKGVWTPNGGFSQADCEYEYFQPCTIRNPSAGVRLGFSLESALSDDMKLKPIENEIDCDSHTYHYDVVGDGRPLYVLFRDIVVADNSGLIEVTIDECLSCSVSQPSDSILGYRTTETHQVVTYALRNKPELSYQWIATGGYLLGETTKHYCDVIWGYDKTGSVCCIVSDSTCTDTVCVDVAINNATTGGIAGDVPTEPTMSARPNPTSDMIDISSVDATDATSYTLVDVTGRVMQQVHGQRTRMSVEDVPSGVYHLLMKNAEGTVVAMQRVVVQR